MGLEHPPGTQELMTNDRVPDGMNGSTVTFPNLTTGKKVAIFGVGDQASYSENFCDAAGELYDCFTAKGATVFGRTSTDGYDHSESKAVVDDKFVGLMCDEDNQYDASEKRAADWIAQLKEEGFF